MKNASLAAVVLVASLAHSVSLAEARWSSEKANAWYQKQPWLVGANFVPSTAINQLEMWQADTFDPATIDRELGWASAVGMNTMRVFLHDIPWRQESDAFFTRIDRYLEIAERHHIRTLFVIFDGVWHPEPRAGKQPEPVPGVHNSGWVQSPGKTILSDSAAQDALKPYVQGLLRRYGNDSRVVMWDLFNEPDNPNSNSHGAKGTNIELDAQAKAQRATELLQKTFQWAREMNPSQPLTAGVWVGDYLRNPSPIARLMLDQSDVISFHSYDKPPRARHLTEGLKALGRPVVCTEYMARGNGSTFEEILPIFKEHRVGAYNWGLVDGKSQTTCAWSTWQEPAKGEPNPWFHDVFRRDGTPYRPEEIAFLKAITAR